MRRGMARPLALCLALLVATPALVRGDEGTINPDRPGITNDANTVGRGVIQVEGGLQYSRTSLAGEPDERRFSVQATLRVGLTESLEARLDGEPVVWLRAAEDDTGFGDVTLGLKWRLFDPPKDSAWPALGVLPFVKINTARSPIGSERPDGGVVGLASFDLPAGVGLDLNAGVTAVGQEDGSGFLLQAFLGAQLSYAFTKQLKAGAEFVFQGRDDRTGGDQALVQVGASYLVTRDFAVDASFGTSVIGEAPDYIAKAGMSVRFGR
jgi:hypothetical protein